MEEEELGKAATPRAKVSSSSSSSSSGSVVPKVHTFCMFLSSLVDLRSRFVAFRFQF